MSKTLVTGASGHIGRKTLQKLLDRRPASDLVGLARDPEKAADLAAQGIEIRQGDYLDQNSLLRAFTDVETLLLVPTHAFTDRNTQHINVIKAARQAGVQRLVYTPIIRPEDSQFVLQEVTKPDLFTLQELEASGLTYTIAAHPPFTESMPFYIGENAFETGVRVPAGDGKAAWATRDDLAEAQAVILTEPGHENQTYALHGNQPVSFADVAGILSELHGAEVAYAPVTDKEYIDQSVANGLPEAAAGFALGWARGINAGEWGNPSGDLEKLLGRTPTTVSAHLRDHYPTAQ